MYKPSIGTEDEDALPTSLQHEILADTAIREVPVQSPRLAVPTVLGCDLSQLLLEAE
jgi:hypothetical protein